MGFLYVDIEVPELIAGLLNLITHVKFMLMMLVSNLGLFDQVFPWGHDRDAFLSGNLPFSSPAPTTTLSPVILDNIKRRLPVVYYGDFLDRSLEGVQSEEALVCLGCLERRHEMRELSNCCHVFHRECLDKWVDESQVTCPLCRSMLLPISVEADKIRVGPDGGQSTWLVDTISYLFGYPKSFFLHQHMYKTRNMKGGEKEMKIYCFKFPFTRL